MVLIGGFVFGVIGKIKLRENGGGKFSRERKNLRDRCLMIY